MNKKSSLFHWHGKNLFLPKWRSTQLLAQKGYTRFVGILKVALSIKGLLLLGLLLLWPTLTQSPVLKVPPDAALLQMIHPSFTGVDEQNRPFSMKAEKAIPVSSGATLIDLVTVEGDFTTSDNQPLKITSENGRYNRDKKELHLSGHVTLHQGDEYIFVTSEADANIGNSTAWGNQPVHGYGPMGRVEATGFQLIDKGMSLVLTGPAHMVLNQESQR